jgi:hypothetical protein
MKTDSALSDSSRGMLTTDRWKNHYLGTDEKFTFTPSDILNSRSLGDFWPEHAPLQSADIGVIVTYYPWFIPWQRSKAFRFEAHRQTNGKFYWYSLPLR